MNAIHTTIETVLANPTQFVGELTYINYAYNRDLGMTPESYASMFSNFPMEAYEARYQREQDAVRQQDADASEIYACPIHGKQDGTDCPRC